MAEVTSEFENQDYEILRAVRGSARDGSDILGQNHTCRFCGASERNLFRTTAHSFPEGLGNKWITSADECDLCNALFSKYDDALCKSVGPLLTIGGVKGKGGKIRQTGRSVGSHNFKHKTNDGKAYIKTELMSKSKNIKPPIGTSINFIFDQNPLHSGLQIHRTPTPDEKFVPLYAYKCLTKMGFSLIPHDELYSFTKLKKWLQTPDDNCNFPFLDVGISTGSLSNAPEVVAAVIFRRRRGAIVSPEYIFCFCAGSICWQIELRADSSDTDLPPIEFGQINIDWSMSPQYDDSRTIDRFTTPCHFDWKSCVAELIPVSTICYSHSPTEGSSFDVEWRSSIIPSPLEGEGGA
jgi:hypothetical protein